MIVFFFHLVFGDQSIYILFFLFLLIGSFTIFGLPIILVFFNQIFTTISIPHIGQASPFGQSLSDRDVFRLRLAPVDQILTNDFHTLRGNHDDHFWDQILMRHTRQV